MKKVGRVTSTGYQSGSASGGYVVRLQFSENDEYLRIKNGELAMVLRDGVVFAVELADLQLAWCREHLTLDSCTLARAPGSTAQLDLRSSPEGVVDLS